MKQKTYYTENYVPKVNTFKIPKVGKVEHRIKMTETEYNNLRFKYFWIGAFTGIAILAILLELSYRNLLPI